MRNLSRVSLWKTVLQTFHMEILNSPFAKSLLSYRLCGFHTYVHNRKSSISTSTNGMSLVSQQSQHIWASVSSSIMSILLRYARTTVCGEREGVPSLELQRSNHAASKFTLALSSYVYFIYLVINSACARILH